MKNTKKYTKMLAAFEQKTRENGSPYYVCNDKSFQELIRKAHCDKMPDDFVYSTIYDVLTAWIDREVQTAEEAENVLFEMEPDIYTSGLTAWLNSNNSRVYYLTEALSFGCSDGFGLLAAAQKIEIEEIGRELINGLF
jgi:hypothetical protein